MFLSQFGNLDGGSRADTICGFWKEPNAVIHVTETHKNIVNSTKKESQQFVALGAATLFALYSSADCHISIVTDTLASGGQTVLYPGSARYSTLHKNSSLQSNILTFCSKQLITYKNEGPQNLVCHAAEITFWQLADSSLSCGKFVQQLAGLQPMLTG